MRSVAHIPEVFARVIDSVGRDVAAHYRSPGVRLTPVGYEDRPFTHLLKMAVADDGGAALRGHVFVKVLKPRDLPGGLPALRARLSRDFEATRRVYLAMLAEPDVGAVPPIACYPDELTIVTEEVAGPTLLQFLERDATWFPNEAQVARLEDTVRRVGRWIARFQAIDPVEGATTVEALRAYIDVRLQRLVGHGGRSFGAADRERVLRHIDWLSARIAAADLRSAPVHADMALGNVLVAADRVVVLDFEMANVGTRLHDVARLFLQLELLAVKPHVRPRLVARLQAALLRGFDPSLRADDPLLRLLLLMHRINHLTTLTVTPARFLPGLYNGLVRRTHRRQTFAEIGRGAGV